MNKITTDLAPKAIGPYSQAIVSGGFLFASGQIPIDPVTGQIAGDTIEVQSEQIMKNISAILTAAGSDFSKVVKTTCFLTDIQNFGIFNEIYATYFTSLPARSCVEVSRLPKGVQVEVEIIAEL